MKYYYAGGCRFDIYLINPISVRISDNDPRVRVFSSKKARDAYVEGLPGVCALPARIAHKWVNNYIWADSYAYADAHTVEDYLRRYPQNDLRSL